ncbi:hypothetical protein NDU88_007639 [Pleurodeles waltl]|uniref:Uncharacterized protein n=1 Tax=Pleurodeles waltl TaxID=8319 RepID=A0AAV7QLB0_PLEWA|nr:hypothetical protein NDU88_007639 [Pleurodeles waltl]
MCATLALRRRDRLAPAVEREIEFVCHSTAYAAFGASEPQLLPVVSMLDYFTATPETSRQTRAFPFLLQLLHFAGLTFHAYF